MATFANADKDGKQILIPINCLDKLALNEETKNNIEKSISAKDKEKYVIFIYNKGTYTTNVDFDKHHTATPDEQKSIMALKGKNTCAEGGARRRSSGRKGRRSKRRSSGRRPRRSKRRSSGKKRRHRKGSCANKRKSRSCRNSKRCTWAKGRKGSRGHCRRSKNRK